MTGVVLTAYDSSGAPLTGLSPTWYACKVASTGADVTGPVFDEIGGGQYTTALPIDQTGFVNFGATASQRYQFIPPGDGTVVAPAWDSSGVPKAGLTLTWESYRDQSAGTSISPQASFFPLGLGMYRIDGLTNPLAVGVIDETASAAPRYAAMINPPGFGPVTTQDPASGTTITPSDAITVTVTDDNADLTIIILVAFWTVTATGDPLNWPREEIHDGESFAPNYAGASTRTALSNGWQYVIRRRNGWPTGVTTEIKRFAADEAGFAIP